MSKQKNRTFRLSFIRRRIITLCQSRALRAALLAELHGGPDAALVVEMVEWAKFPTRPPQVVTPMPQQNEEETRAEVPNPTMQPVDPQRQERPDPPINVETPPQEEATDTLGDSAATAVVIVDSDSDYSD